MTVSNDVGVGKRDLHVGGVGVRKAVDWDARLDNALTPVIDLSEQLARQARRAAQSADDYVHDHPWSAIGVVALVGLATGFFIARRY